LEMFLKPTKWPKFSYLRGECLHSHNTDKDIIVINLSY